MSGYYPVIILPPRHSDAKITYRNRARQGVNVEIDMKASGHTSVHMHEVPGSAKGRHCEAFRIVTGWNSRRERGDKPSRPQIVYRRRRKVPGGAAGLQK
jgi:hypothetical protein